MGASWQMRNSLECFFAYADESNRATKKRKGSPIEFVAEKDGDLLDGLIANKAISELKLLNKQEHPFFLAVGFLKPTSLINRQKQRTSKSVLDN